MFTFTALIAWSVFLSYLWELGTYSTLIVCGLGMHVGLRYYRLREAEDDTLSYKFYNVSKDYPCSSGRNSDLTNKKMIRYGSCLYMCFPHSNVGPSLIYEIDTLFRE
jgi:hypothetical protein